jgi:hypothetical protein
MIFLKVVELRKWQGNICLNLGYCVPCSYRSIKLTLNCVFLFWALFKVQKRRIVDNLPLWSAQVRPRTLSAQIPASLLANLIQVFANTAIVESVRTLAQYYLIPCHTQPLYNFIHIETFEILISDTRLFSIHSWCGRFLKALSSKITDNADFPMNYVSYVKCVSTSEEVDWLNKG